LTESRISGAGRLLSRGEYETTLLSGGESRRRAGTVGQRFTTDDVAATERLDYWRDAICDVFVQLDCTSARRRGFYGHVSSEALESVSLSVVDADGQHVVRGRRQLAKASEDDFLLSVQMHGTGMVRQDGRDAPLRRGAMALYASTRPYELIFPGPFRQLVLQLPRTVLSQVIADPDALTATALSPEAPETRLLGAFLAELQASATMLSPASRAHVASSVVQSLAAALATLPSAAPPRGFDGRAQARSRICAYVEAHLDEPALSPASIAAALGFSRQHLHRLFAAGDESLDRRIWRSRLERVRTDLANPALAHFSIADVASRRGFTSPEHFSRVFRAHYGTTPSAYRRDVLDA
jgi:AraC-like DNA-binding protein